MLSIQAYTRQFVGKSFAARLFSRHSVVLNDSQEHGDVSLSSELDHNKKSANIESNSEQCKEPLKSDDLACKEPPKSEELAFKELLKASYVPPQKRKKPYKYDPDGDEIMSTENSFALKMYTDSVMNKMYGKTILSSAKKYTAKKSSEIREQLDANSCDNSEKHYLANIISSKKDNEKKSKSNVLKTSKLSKKKDVEESFKGDDKPAMKDSAKKASLEENPAADISIDHPTKIDRAAAGMNDIHGATDGDVQAETNDKTATLKEGSGNLAVSMANDLQSSVSETKSLIEQRKSILQIPFRQELRKTMPSVSKVLKVSMSDERKMILERWEKGMIKKLGEQGFKEYSENTFRRGHALHSLMERYLLYGETMNADNIEDEVTRNHVRSISHVLPSLKDVQALESAVIHPDLQYCGIVDCIARIGDTMCLIDWKTSEKAKPTVESLYDNPLQIVAYLGAINADPNYARLGRIKHGAVVVVYNTGYPAVIHRFSTEQLRKFWFQWVQRIKIFDEKSAF